MDGYYKIDQDDYFELHKKAILYKYIVTQGFIYDKDTDRCLGHTTSFYYEKNGDLPDLSKYEIRFADGEIQQIL